tara:strand:- start:105 stop:305 length:201 start_codon:yes stop_codon:yes gene_type:complete
MAFKMKKATIYKLVDDNKKKSSKPNDKKDKKKEEKKKEEKKNVLTRWSDTIEDKDIPLNKDGEREF